MPDNDHGMVKITSKKSAYNCENAFEPGSYAFRQFLIETHGLRWKITLVHRELALLKQKRGGMTSHIL